MLLRVGLGPFRVGFKAYLGLVQELYRDLFKLGLG